MMHYDNDFIETLVPFPFDFTLLFLCIQYFSYQNLSVVVTFCMFTRDSSLSAYTQREREGSV